MVGVAEHTLAHPHMNFEHDTTFHSFIFNKFWVPILRGAAKGGSTRSMDPPVLIVVGPGRSRSDFLGSDSYFLGSDPYFLG